MDFSNTIKSLYEERNLLNQVITTLERLHAGAHGRRRGRPPKWLAEVRGSVEHNAADEAVSSKTRKKNMG
jgi:hypothetical protein